MPVIASTDFTAIWTKPQIERAKPANIDEYQQQSFSRNFLLCNDFQLQID